MGPRGVENSDLLPVDLQSGFGSSQPCREPDGACQPRRCGLFKQIGRRIYDYLIVSLGTPQRTGIGLAACTTIWGSMTCGRNLDFCPSAHSAIHFRGCSFLLDGRPPCRPLFLFSLLSPIAGVVSRPLGTVPLTCLCLVHPTDALRGLRCRSPQ